MSVSTSPDTSKLTAQQLQTYLALKAGAPSTAQWYLDRANNPSQPAPTPAKTELPTGNVSSTPSLVPGVTFSPAQMQNINNAVASRQVQAQRQIAGRTLPKG